MFTYPRPRLSVVPKEHAMKYYSREKGLIVCLGKEYNSCTTSYTIVNVITIEVHQFSLTQYKLFFLLRIIMIIRIQE